jgi:signal transduction histidine kinase
MAIEQELWRILQEAMANVERHAGARALVVRWSCDGQHGRLEVVDDGCGFDPADTAGGGTTGAPASGMMAMRERANAISARLLIESSVGYGTRLLTEVETAS